MIQKGSIPLYRVYWGPPCFNGVSQWLKEVLYPFLQVYNPFLQANRPFYSFWSLVLFQNWQIRSGKNSFKMIQKGSIPFTGYLKAPLMVKDLLYPILQAHSPFLQANRPFYSFWSLVLFQNWQIRSGKNSFKMVQNGSISPHRPPPCFNGVSQWLKSSYTPFYKQTTHFYKPRLHFHSFCFKSSKFEAGKMR